MADGICPCGKRVQVNENRTIPRHKDPDGEWCDRAGLTTGGRG